MRPGARDQYAALLPVEERVLGPKHTTPRMSGTTSPTGPEGLAKAGRELVPWQATFALPC